MLFLFLAIQIVHMYTFISFSVYIFYNNDSNFNFLQCIFILTLHFIVNYVFFIANKKLKLKLL